MWSSLFHIATKAYTKHMTESYFDLLGIPVSLQPDLGLMQQQFIRRQRQFHPDFFSQASAEEQEMALEKTAQLNEAIRVLKDPMARLGYVLGWHGVLDPNEKYALPPDFLMEMMELSEAAPEVARQEAEAREAELDAELAIVAGRYSGVQTSVGDLETLKRIYFQKKYLHRLLANNAD